MKDTFQNTTAYLIVKTIKLYHFCASVFFIYKTGITTSLLYRVIGRIQLFNMCKAYRTMHLWHMASIQMLPIILLQSLSSWLFPLKSETKNAISFYLLNIVLQVLIHWEEKEIKCIIGKDNCLYKDNYSHRRPKRIKKWLVLIKAFRKTSVHMILWISLAFSYTNINQLEDVIGNKIPIKIATTTQRYLGKNSTKNA